MEAVHVDYAAKKALVTVKPGTDPESVVAGLKSPYSAKVL